MSTIHHALNGLPLALRYALFCLASAAVNLATQVAALRIYQGPFMLLIAMSLATLSGLLAKYFLDKRWIFADTATGLDAHARRFSRYAVTGAITTVLFWSTEYTFDTLTPDGRFRLVGAAVGLSAGYILKFRLDRRFVFAENAA